ncbi:heme ABC exporter ATP-binding protein CcmA [Aureimonas sp. ME7]|uniref:heme ABC exporter ATP-binding protein CcmA n=1 Tax=Aureimonas sp. ME7 TaxID=2744252 RepID=UPI001FCE83AE|nr:heme ABC exporter ATP-binding protein CcmA [Aureimonas sp. ME7]
MIAITLTDLVCGRAGRAATRPIDWRLTGGEALVVTGPNGAGKSTLLRTLAGLLPPVAGAIRIEGALPGGEPAGRLIELAHYFGHRNAMKPGRTVAEELGFWRRFLGRPAAGIEQALAAVDLPHAGRLPVGALSAGQQRRVAFARLLVSDRPIWLLDEPTTALDAASQARISELCRERLRGGGIVIAATHQPLELAGARILELVAPEPVAAAASDGGWDEVG